MRSETLRTQLLYFKVPTYTLFTEKITMVLYCTFQGRKMAETAVMDLQN